MRQHYQLAAAKNYFLGFATSGIILFCGLFYFNDGAQNDELQTDFSTLYFAKEEAVSLKEFNPNALSESDWRKLGFSERQVATILKYKDIVGGNFSSKEQLKKCYAISEEKFVEIEPFILLPESSSDSFQNNKNYYGNREYSSFGNNYKSQKLRIPGKFNPDKFSAEDFIRMGFTEKQAASIIKYKNYLGGSFVSKEKFKECFIISEDNYQKMAPYLLLPEKTPTNFASFKYSNQNDFSKPEKTKIIYQNFDPNTLDIRGWVNLGFSEKQAQVIVNYRDRNLKGSFKNLEDIKRCFVISEEKFHEIKPFIVLSTETIKHQSTEKSVEDNSPKNTSFKTPIAETKTDFSKTDLNTITFKQLVEYGFDEKSAGSLIGFRNKLGGFVNKKQILDTYNIDKDLAQRLVSTAHLNSENVQKYSLMDAPESWLKNHPYFKYYADKIIYYRISFTNEKKFFRTMNIKPEAEEKMKLYLK